jgi:hypothetical protein
MSAAEGRTIADMPAQPSFRSRLEIEGGGHRGRRRAGFGFPAGKSVFLAGLAVLVLMSAGMLALRSLAISIKNGGDDVEVAAEKPAPSVPTESKDPFAGTPAENFPVGADGIVPPVAKQVGPWTPAQVQDVMNRAKQTLIAARLDPLMVEQGVTTTYLGSISPATKQAVAGRLETGEALSYVSRLATDYKLLAPIRVQGTMTAALGPKKELVVNADYLWVYPLQGPDVRGARRGPGSRLVVVHTIESYQWFAAKNVAKQDTGLRPGVGKLYTFNMDCDLATSGRLGLQRAAPGSPQTVPDAKAYDPLTKPEDLPNTC